MSATEAIKNYLDQQWAKVAQAAERSTVGQWLNKQGGNQGLGKGIFVVLANAAVWLAVAYGAVLNVKAGGAYAAVAIVLLAIITVVLLHRETLKAEGLALGVFVLKGLALILVVFGILHLGIYGFLVVAAGGLLFYRQVILASVVLIVLAALGFLGVLFNQDSLMLSFLAVLFLAGLAMARYADPLALVAVAAIPAVTYLGLQVLSIDLVALAPGLVIAVTLTLIAMATAFLVLRFPPIDSALGGVVLATVFPEWLVFSDSGVAYRAPFGHGGGPTFNDGWVFHLDKFWLAVVLMVLAVLIIWLLSEPAPVEDQTIEPENEDEETTEALASEEQPERQTQVILPPGVKL